MPSRRGGRPRSDRAHRAVLEATRDLLTRDGYDSLTIDAIASRAGVGRQTVYRWWPTKAAVVAEAVTAGFGAADIPSPPDTGDIAADLDTWLNRQIDTLRDPHLAAMVRALAAAAAENSDDAERLYALVTGPLRQALTQRMTRAAELGQLRTDAALDTFAEALIAHLLYRLLTGTHHTTGHLTDLLLHGAVAR
ncbi:TetR/AcrR family transcriptional regulator [Nocardia nova]|uniref:TetR/AcrR family transcriptional regulator n=1 Tax=Nocardia nova TaxID=37330 RepID=UPI0007A4F947|nr:TetR/AcrR family transcriptional regulator [Nocardia nova]